MLWLLLVFDCGLITRNILGIGRKGSASYVRSPQARERVGVLFSWVVFAEVFSEVRCDSMDRLYFVRAVRHVERYVM